MVLYIFNVFSDVICFLEVIFIVLILVFLNVKVSFKLVLFEVFNINNCFFCVLGIVLIIFDK